MKKALFIFLLLSLSTYSFSQTYVKFNLATPFIGGVNPSVETAISKHWTFSFDILATFKNETSTSGPMRILMVMPEGRYFLKEKFNGFYGGINFGYAMSRMSKPTWLDNTYKNTKGFDYSWTMVLGFTIGYEYKINDRWLSEIFIGGGRAWSMHDRYTFDGQKQTYPDGTPIKINGSAEYLPYKGGINICYRLGK